MAEIPSAGVSRRALLAAGTSLALAGCLGDGDDSNETTDEPTTDGTDDIHRPNGTGDGPDNETDAPSGTDDPEPQPRGRVRSLTVTGKSFPTTVRPNRGLITAAVLTNTGDGEGDVTVTATLRGDDGVVAKETTTRTLAAGSDATVPLTGTPDALLGQTIASTGPGTYELVATSDGDGRTARLTVQTPATPALSALDFGETPITTDRTELSPTVTLANEGDIAGVFDVTFRLSERTDDLGVLREATASQQVTPGDEARLTVPVDVSGLAPGTYRVTVTAVPEDAPARETSVTGELSVEQAPGKLDITVYTQAADEEYEARSGTLRVREQGADEPLLTHDLSDSPSVTVSDGVATGETYELTTENIDDGVYPDGEETVTVDGTTEVDFVTAYEFQGADSFRLAAYLFAPNPSPPDVIDPSANYYIWATHAADGDHYARDYRVAGSTTYDPDDSIHNHGVSLRQFQRSGAFAPREQVRIDGEAYGHRYGSGPIADDSPWDEIQDLGYDPASPPRANAGEMYPARTLTELTGADPEKQQFTGTVEIDGQTLHQYDLSVENYPNSRAFVNPETGYVVRWEAQKSYAGPSEQGYEIWTYSDHGTIDSLSLPNLKFGGTEPPF
jgi:hypothetical protein